MILLHLRPLFPDANTLQSKSGYFIFWQFEDNFYPEENWIDNAHVILSWWLYELLSLSPTIRRVKLRFMEGPYSLVLSQKNSTLVLQQEGIDVCSCSKLEFFGAFHSAVRELLNYTKKLNYTDDYLKYLEDNLGELQLGTPPFS